WYKNQAHVLIFMILNFVFPWNSIFLQSDGGRMLLPPFLHPEKSLLQKEIQVKVHFMEIEILLCPVI
ncbi:hypothetical protein, partial [Angelakisella massiliensis]|uniref:hypothetical protein n=1 Tax=Angelakisella massiliensis TaxID=1871018 RepID=UPI0024B106BD